MSEINSRRGLRDPADIGRLLASYREAHPEDTRKASEIMDDFALNIMARARDVDPGESTVVETQRAYRARLIKKAFSGDDHALRRLEEIDPVTAGAVRHRIKAGGIFHPDRDLHERAVERFTVRPGDTYENGQGERVKATFEDPDPGDADKGTCPAYNAAMDIHCELEAGHLHMHYGVSPEGHPYLWQGK